MAKKVLKHFTLTKERIQELITNEMYLIKEDHVGREEMGGLQAHEVRVDYSDEFNAIKDIEITWVEDK